MSTIDKKVNELLEKNGLDMPTNRSITTFNPDLVVNRFSLLIPLIQTADTIKSPELRNFLIAAAAIIVESVKQGCDLVIEEVEDEDETYH
tara:strand:- start:689 stop:958 length:270 start_codon:yes stop_codon:yes gene_type:complete